MTLANKIKLNSLTKRLQPKK